MRTQLATIGIVAALALAGCGDSDDDSAADKATDSVSSAASDASSAVDDEAKDDGEASDGDDSAATAEPEASGGASGASDEQRSAGFPTAGENSALIPVGTTVKPDPEMVIFSFQGVGLPEYEVKYVETAKDAKTDKDLDIAGDHIMQVTLTGLTKEGSAQAVSGKQDTEGDSIKDIYLGEVVDGTSVSFIGLDAQRPYQAIVNRSAPPGFVIKFTD